MYPELCPPCVFRPAQESSVQMDRLLESGPNAAPRLQVSGIRAVSSLNAAIVGVAVHRYEFVHLAESPAATL